MRSPTDGHASRMRRLFVRIVPVGTVLIAWELATRLNVVNPYVFPPVSEIVLRWVTLVAGGTMLGPLWDTLWRALLGLGMPRRPEGAGAAYEKLSLVAGDFAILSVAAIAGDDLRVAIGGYAMTPLLVAGLDPAGEVREQAARELARLPAPPGDQRASTGYRRRVAPELVRRAVHAAMRARHA